MKKMKSLNNFLLISANIGSTFDFPDRMFSSWINCVTVTIQQHEPIFFAIHCQEVGGKNYEESMQYVDNFVKLLLKDQSLNCYNKARIYLDEDFTVEEKFTALGSFYFIHESVSNVQQWDFIANEFISVEGRELFSANIEHITHKYKEKFPLEFFPENKWSRKGFIHTRWKILDVVVDFVNIHLFHDICNLAPIIKDPSTYSACRSRALQYTLEKVTKNYSEKISLFIFGDFNFRLTTQKLIKQLVEPRTTIENVYKKSQGKNEEIRKIVYRKLESPIDKSMSFNDRAPNRFDKDDTILEIGRKIFDMPEFNSCFVEKSEMFRKFDEEPTNFFQYLHEFPVSFPPSYPFNEEENNPNCYMKTRCPSWCDRIFLNPEAKILIRDNLENVKYHMIGLGSCVGDHKPIYLSFCLSPSDNQINYEVQDEENINDNTYTSDETNAANDIELDSNMFIDIKKLSTEEINITPKFISNNSSNRRLFNSVVTNDFSRRKRHSVVDSINGLRASIDIDKCNEMWNIFDNGRFDKETELDIKFRLSHRPYVSMSSSANELSKTPNNTRTAQSLFIQAAKSITTAENVISAFRQSINRKRKISDSSSENDHDEGQNNKIIGDDIIVETYQIAPYVNNNANPQVQVVPKNKKLCHKNTCCAIS